MNTFPLYFINFNCFSESSYSLLNRRKFFILFIYNLYPLNIKIIGHQWFWSYEINEFNKEFDSFLVNETKNNFSDFRNLDVDNNLIVPVNNNIKLFVTSIDVIHAGTIPGLGVKIDAIPGRLNQLSFSRKLPGLFFGQC
jgi:heme/copper-type cytochrome/quinol oxidase subunit 2